MLATHTSAKQHGFTIVELLIVVVVIAILAAISIVSYTTISSQSKLSAAKANLNTINKKLEVYKINNGSYPPSTDNATWKSLLSESAGVISGTNNYALCRTTSGDRFAVIAWQPLIPVNNTPVGSTMNFVSSDQSGVTTAAYAGQGSYGTVSQAACQVVAPGTTGYWSFDL
jgi:prepilin-type N-terminal cleavage/methylation domain-containing protein